MNKHLHLIATLTIIILIVFYLIISLPYDKFIVSFLDVGQGDSIYVGTPDDYRILIDGGPSMKVVQELSDKMPIYTKTIDILFLTHPHADHVNGLVEVLKRYSVKKIFAVGTPSKNSYYKKFLQLVESQKIPIYFVNSTEDLKVGKYLYIDIIWPAENLAGIHFDNLNNASLSMRVLFQNQSIVLTGDAETEQEEEILISEDNIKGNILKAGHHGSKTASSDEFLKAVNPEIAVIQCGKDNSFSHPHKETLLNFLKRGIEVRRNDIEGRIDFIFSLF